MPPATDARSDPGLVWLHPVFCQLALPVASVPAPWQRQEGGGLQLAFDAGAGSDHPVPSGWAPRRLLMHLCDQAVRTNSTVVELGADASALAADLGLPADEAVLQELRTQIERLAAGKLSVAWEQQPVLAVFDARAQRYHAPAAWRPRLRLSSRFHASLVRQAVPLDRAIVTALAAEPLALDAHGWIRHKLQQQPAGHSTTTAWPELQRRFGSPEQGEQAFRAAFEDALRMVFAVDFSISLAADEDGVTVGALPPEAAATEAVVPPQRHEAVAVVEAPPPAATQAPRAEPQPAPTPAPVQNHRPVVPPAPAPSQPIGLRQHLTGLPGVVWLRQGHADEPLVIGVTPGARFEPDRMTLLMLEPLVMQVSGGLYEAEFTRVSDWIGVNRALIDQVWAGEISTLEQASGQVRKAPASLWR
ncbi:replication protein RepA [Roseomonas haemaphysalidis]|uniref:Uncharacterized protein n=1 Tax=Roseomonas haemaphysalidis TaxID=2768162 RepID=A0ABS3KLI1_9PROT|nr:replication protein RepA [Roseomonas haemaphysalidis]MBO1078329.1 hypothetical protein [Roseomonas haemaphysalidis]